VFLGVLASRIDIYSIHRSSNPQLFMCFYISLNYLLGACLGKLAHYIFTIHIFALGSRSYMNLHGTILVIILLPFKVHLFFIGIIGEYKFAKRSHQINLSIIIQYHIHNYAGRNTINGRRTIDIASQQQD